MLQEFNLAARVVNLDPGIWNILTHPKRQIIVSCPVMMDSGEIKVFTGYRVQYNITLGPAKGGIRYHPDVSLDEVTTLAAWMATSTPTFFPSSMAAASAAGVRAANATVRANTALLLMARELGGSGLETLEVACDLTLQSGVICSAVVVNAMQRLTEASRPKTLESANTSIPQLTLEPIADCGRYDSLRRVTYVH